MKIFKAFIIKMFNLYKNSYLGLHLIILVSCLLLFVISNFIIDFNRLQIVYVDILNGMGVISAFLILAIDKIDFEIIINNFDIKDKNFVGNSVKTSSKIINTVFSIVLSVFILLGVQYILLILNIKLLFLLIYLILYNFIGFIYVLSTWHGIELNYRS